MKYQYMVKNLADYSFSYLADLAGLLGETKGEALDAPGKLTGLAQLSHGRGGRRACFVIIRHYTNFEGI